MANDWAMHCFEHLNCLRPEAAVGLFDFDRVRRFFVGQHFAIEHVATGRFCDPVKKMAVVGVYGIGNGKLIAHDEAQRGDADLSRSVHVHAGRGELDFKIGLLATPGKMRIHQQHGFAIGGVRRSDGPAVGAVNQIFGGVPEAVVW